MRAWVLEHSQVRVRILGLAQGHILGLPLELELERTQVLLLGMLAPVDTLLDRLEVLLWVEQRTLVLGTSLEE